MDGDNKTAKQVKKKGGVFCSQRRNELKKYPTILKLGDMWGGGNVNAYRNVVSCGEFIYVLVKSSAIPEKLKSALVTCFSMNVVISLFLFQYYLLKT